MKQLPAAYIVPLLSLIAVVSMATTGCKSKDLKKKETKPWVLRPESTIDTSIQNFYHNRLYIPYVVRMEHPSGKAFIFMDTFKTQKNVKQLRPEEREAFYKTVITEVPPADIEGHKIAWSLPEIQALQVGDGGYGTVFTTVAGRPLHDTGDYVIEVRKNNIFEFPLHTVYAYVKYKPATREFMLADNSGYYVPLSSVRAIKK